MNDTAATEKGRLAALRNENAALKHRLNMLQDSHEALQLDYNYNHIKVAELTDIIELRGKDNPLMTKLSQKSTENVELSREVQSLRAALLESKNVVTRMEQEREERKHMLLELSGIVRALQSVKIAYTPPAGEKDINSTTSSLQNVKRKVETIIEDRRILVARCMELEEMNSEKDDKIMALEAQFHLLNSMNMARGDEDLNQAETSIARAASFSTVSTISGDSIRSRVENTQHSYQARAKTLSTGDVESYISETTAPTTDCSTQSVSHNSVESAEIRSLQSQLASSNARYTEFKEVCQGAFSKMKYVEAEVIRMHNQYDEAVHKRDELKVHLKEVIGQYKELHSEQERMSCHYNEAKSKIEALEKQVQEFEDIKKEVDELGARILEDADVSKDINKLVLAYKRALHTIAALEKKVDSAVSEAEKADKQKNVGSRKYRDSVAQCKKLSDDIAALKLKLSHVERQLQNTKKEAQFHRDEARHARRRLTALMNSGKTCKSARMPEEVSSDVLRRILLAEASAAGKAWNKRYTISKARDDLLVENNELKMFREGVASGVMVQ
eukprot:Nitzschia sp. Nitz4//scaffold77_size91520//15734//17407//NITZ4_004880-RA/size91520-processed-gene-0.24-mRNA-1//1//CDS//3329557961//3925//frame0